MRRSQDRDASPVVGYVRVSTEEQASSGVSLAAQERAIRNYATARGLELVELVIDAGVSAGTPLSKRRGGALVLDAVRSGRAGSVVAIKLGRLAKQR